MLSSQNIVIVTFTAKQISNIDDVITYGRGIKPIYAFAHALLNPNLEAEMGSAVPLTSTLYHGLMVKHFHYYGQYNGSKTNIA
jgi:hypothetical protein